MTDQPLIGHSRFLLGGLLLAGLLWLVLAALSAHGASVLRPDLLETARDVHGLHLLAGLVLLAIHQTLPIRWINALIGLLWLGMILFSGTLYLKGWGYPHGFAALTPIGGLLLMLFWLGALVECLTRPSRP